eukprot:6190955-Pleurochrysis_carterae.AAC.4
MFSEPIAAASHCDVPVLDLRAFCYHATSLLVPFALLFCLLLSELACHEQRLQTAKLQQSQKLERQRHVSMREQVPSAASLDLHPSMKRSSPILNLTGPCCFALIPLFATRPRRSSPAVLAVARVIPAGWIGADARECKFTRAFGESYQSTMKTS